MKISGGDFVSEQLRQMREKGVLPTVRRKWKRAFSPEYHRNPNMYKRDLGPAHAEAAAIRAAQQAGNGCFDVVYDNLTSPPSYGDTFTVIMLARYLAVGGADVSFTFLDPPERRERWGHARMNADEQAEFVSHQLQLAQSLLPSRVDCEVVSGPQSTRRPPRSGRYLFDEMVARQETAQTLASTLIKDLIATGTDETLSRFLLRLEDFPDQAEQVRSHPPYVAWGIRRGKWDKSRDTTKAQLLRDFASIRESFPSEHLMLFSTKAGVNWALETIAAQIPDPGPVVAQPATDFVSAVPWALGSRFYFQRLGGGMQIVPVFSTTPYYQLVRTPGVWNCDDTGRIAPWQTSAQVFECRLLGAGSARVTIVKRTP